MRIYRADNIHLPLPPGSPQLHVFRPNLIPDQISEHGSVTNGSMELDGDVEMDLGLPWYLESENAGLESRSYKYFHHVDDEVPDTDCIFSPRDIQPLKPGTSKLRKRIMLPIIIGHGKDATMIVSCPDSGSDENFISLETVNRLGLRVAGTDGERRRRFSLANGKIVESVGQVTAPCSFAAEAPWNLPALECSFHVFSSLAVPMIMGMQFLHQTETLTKHTTRLVEQEGPGLWALQVHSLELPVRNLVCRLDTSVESAIASTGSDLDLVSRDFVESMMYEVEPAREQIEFADCSVGCTSGIIRASFSVGDLSDAETYLPRRKSVQHDFYVLEGLDGNVLIGRDTISDLDVFIPSVPQPGECDVDDVQHIYTMEHIAPKTWDELKDEVLEAPSPVEDSPIGSESSAAETPPSSVDEQPESARLEEERSEAMQRLGVSEILSEEAFSLDDCDILPLDTINVNFWGPGAFVAPVCDFPGCTAPPFAHQEQLNFHNILHYPNYPHFCPNLECSWGPGVMDQVTEHYLFSHDSGDECPFSIDRKYKYPRFSDLVRHVREHYEAMERGRNQGLLKALEEEMGEVGLGFIPTI